MSLPPLRDSMDAPPVGPITITGPISVQFLCFAITIPAVTLPPGLPERLWAMVLDRCPPPAP